MAFPQGESPSFRAGRMSKAANASWLADLVAFQLAPAYARAWLEGMASIGIVGVSVTPGPRGNHAWVRLQLDDDHPALAEEVAVTDFPEGCWEFYLGTDEGPGGIVVTTMILPQEY
jgi:hypothetical protein